MKDDFFDFLVATDKLDDFLGKELRCPNCNFKLIEIIYGMPDSSIFEKVEQGEVFLGGCVIDDFQPKYHCNNCKRSYSGDLKVYIEEENNFE